MKNCSVISDLKNKIYDITGKNIAESSVGIGKQINKYETQLYIDGIEHKTKRKSNQRLHVFKLIDKSCDQIKLLD